jgi:hypothetical protein
MISKFGNLEEALKFAYPEISWDGLKFSHRGKKSTQRWLGASVKGLLPCNTKISENPAATTKIRKSPT